MTDETRDREVAELKARLDALQTAQPARRTKGGCLLPALGIFGVLVVLGMIVNVVQRGRPDPSVDPLKAPSPTCDEGWRDKTLATARRSGVIAGEANDMTDLYVIVRPLQWQRFSLGQRRSLALAEACHLPTGFFAMTVHFRYDREGGDIMKVGHSELLDLGRERFVGASTSAPPKEFQGLKWGAAPPTNFKNLGGGDGATVRTNPDKPTLYLGVMPSDRDYRFQGRRLYGGDLYFKGSEAFDKLKPALAAKFGAASGYEEDGYQQIYKWNWKAEKITAQVIYDTDKQTTSIAFEKR